MGKNSRKNSSKKPQAAPSAAKPSIPSAPSGDASLHPTVDPKAGFGGDPLLTSKVSVSEGVVENGNGRIQSVEEKSRVGQKGTQESNGNGDMSKKSTQAVELVSLSRAEVESSTDDSVGNHNPENQKKKTNNRRKKASHSSSDSRTGEETVDVAKTSNVVDTVAPTETKVDAPIPVECNLPETFVEDHNAKQDQLDQLMTEMKKSLSSSSNVSIPDLLTSGRVLSPTSQPELLPLDQFTEAIAKRETLLTHGLVM